MEPLEPVHDNLRKAIRWLSEQRRHDRQAIEEAARRFDLSPRDEEFLLRHLPGENSQPG